MNVVNAWLAHQCITGTLETQVGLYNYISEEMIYNTYSRFMMRSAEGRSRNIVDSHDEKIDDDNPTFGRINGAPRCGISLNVTPTKKRNKTGERTENKYLLQGECKIFQKKTTHVCSDWQTHISFLTASVSAQSEHTCVVFFRQTLHSP